MLLSTLAISLLGNLITVKRVKWSKILGRGVMTVFKSRLEQVRIFSATSYFD